MPKKLTAHAIDEACRLGHFVYYGNRQKILGAVSDLREHGGEAAPDHVWVNRARDLEWCQVKLSEVVIEQRNGGSMPRGKRAEGSPGPPSKKSEAVQPDLPGVEQEKIPALERLIRKYQKLKLERMAAGKVEKAAKDAVIKMMENEGLPVYKRPGKFKFKAEVEITGKKLKVEEIDEDDDEGTEGELGDDENEEDEDEDNEE